MRKKAHGQLNSLKINVFYPVNKDFYDLESFLIKEGKQISLLVVEGGHIFTNFPIPVGEYI
jgi:hypothetical protein